MSVLIVGAGAVGALFGSALARQGAAVSVVCRSDYEVVKRDGYAITSPLLGNHRFRPAQVYRSVSECQEPPEYLILTVKVLPDVDRAALIRPAVGPRTVIVLIENGLDIEEEIVRAFPSNEVLSAIALVAVGRTGPGRIDHLSLGSLVLGRYPQGATPAAQRLAAMFEAGKIGCKVTDDIVSARWQKAVWNASFNPLSILGDTLDTATILGTPQGETLVRELMNEICAVAAAAGAPQEPALVEKMIAGTKAMPPYKTSMGLDFESGRPMEIEAILGNVVRAARRVGVATPRLETVYAITRMIQEKLARNRA
jgi:2-dehydropantoate 2-reductase